MSLAEACVLLASAFVAVAVWCYVMALGGVSLFRRGHSRTDAAPYGAGPCGVARVTYPLSHGLSVTERH